MKVSDLITIMYFSPISADKGSIVSINILSVGFRVDSTNRDARMAYAWCPFFGMWDSFVQTVQRHVVNVATQCRSFRVVHVASLVLWFVPPTVCMETLY